MGILNVTPDSFSDGGRFDSLEAALNHAEQMIAAGVDIIDIGGESSRPGATTLPLQEELRRVLPVIYALRDCGVPLSVDTCKSTVMLEALDAGVDMINDIAGFRDGNILNAIKDSECGLCIMHMQSTPQQMQNSPEYHDVVAEVQSFLHERVNECETVGISPQRICVDPGFGFGKTLEHNRALLKNIGTLRDALQLPILAGLSRKSMIGMLTGKAVDHRLAGSIAGALVAASNGAAIVRVHDVDETVDALKVWQAAR